MQPSTENFLVAMTIIFILVVTFVGYLLWASRDPMGPVSPSESLPWEAERWASRDPTGPVSDTQQDVVTSKASDFESSLVFRGYDPHLGSHVKIEKSGGVYMMDGMVMEVRRHPQIAGEGLSLVIVDRVGEPDMYYVLHRPDELSIYVNCEFGPCRYKRSIR